MFRTHYLQINIRWAGSRDHNSFLRPTPAPVEKFAISALGLPLGKYIGLQIWIVADDTTMTKVKMILDAIFAYCILYANSIALKFFAPKSSGTDVLTLPSVLGSGALPRTSGTENQPTTSF